MDGDEITLTRPDTPKARFCRISLDGTRLSRATWAAGGKARLSARDVGGGVGEAQHAYLKAVRAKMAEGFVFARDAREARPGELLLEFLAPNRWDSRAFDLRPDGAEVVVATGLPGGYGAEIHIVDVATGERRLVHAEPAGDRQMIVHRVLFDARGTGLVYAIGGRTRHLNLTTGATRGLAEYRQFESSSFNPYCVGPAWDADRRRLLVFDAGDVVRVLDADGEPVWQTCTRSPTTECRAAAISASGRLVALYRVSRGIVYRHQDALHDATNEIEVWDVGTGRPAWRVPVPSPLSGRALDRIGFDPGEGCLITNPDPVQGPCALSADGEVVWHFPDRYRTDRWDTCFSWTFSPAGDVLAIGRMGWRRGLDLRSAATREPVPAGLERTEGHRVQRIVFSRDGRLIAAGGDSGLVTVRVAPTAG